MTHGERWMIRILGYFADLGLLLAVLLAGAVLVYVAGALMGA